MRLAALAIFLVGCASGSAAGLVAAAPSHDASRTGASRAGATAERPADPPPAASAETSAVVGYTVTKSLDVPGYLPAVLVVPPSTATKSPLVIVTHGAGDRPEPDCARYAALTKSSAFVLCMRGRAMNALVPASERRYFYDGHIELGKEVVSAIHALGDAFGARIDLTAVTFAGYSQGAAMGILYLERGGAREVSVRRVLLVEGGSGEFTADIAQSLKHDGVDRIAMVCGQGACHERADRSVRWLERADLDVSSTFAPGAGHTSGGAVAPLVDQAWAWLVDGDRRFQTAEPQ